MANFPCNPMIYVPQGMHFENGWLRPARSRVALGGEPPRRYEQYAIIMLEPEPVQEQIRDIILEVTQTLQEEFPVRVVSAFPSPLSLGFFSVRRHCLAYYSSRCISDSVWAWSSHCSAS